MGDYCFSVLVDESCYVAIKEQMVATVRYINKNGRIIERFLSIQHVTSTTTVALNIALENLLDMHKLSISRIHGQGYDRASSMRGEFGGLKTLILKENPYPSYVHCFVHQLKLALVGVSKKYFHMKALFEFVSRILNTIGVPCKRNDTLKAIQHDKILEDLRKWDLFSGRDLNQETNLQRPCDTRWESHYTTLPSLRYMFSSVLVVLENVMEDGIIDQQSIEASVLLATLQSFDFIFTMHIMIELLEVTNELSQAL